MSIRSAWITDLDSQADQLRRYRHGTIYVESGELLGIRLRSWPKFVTPETIWWGYWTHGRRQGDRCWLHYNHPRGFNQFLALKYIFSTRYCSFSSFRRAVFLLDEIAEIKRCEALLCDAANGRISDRLMRRWGWEAHAPQRWHRNYIKRLGIKRPGVQSRPAKTFEPTASIDLGSSAVVTGRAKGATTDLAHVSPPG